MQSVKNISPRQLMLLLAVLILAVAGLTIPGLFSFDNLTQMLRQISVTGIIALGVTFVVIAGRLDLAVGSLLSLCAVVAVNLHDQVSPFAALTVPVAIGCAVGLLNGFLVAQLRLNSLIVTLGMLSVLQSVSLVYTSGQNALIDYPDATWFASIGRGYILGIPVPVLVFVSLAALMAIVLGRTRFGREVFAVGGNETASRFSTISTKRVVLACYMISGTLTGVAAVVFSSRVMAAQNTSGSGLELQVLSAVILGGTSLTGGAGGIGRTVIGVILLGFIQNALLLMGLPYYVQWLVSWAVIIVVVWADMASRQARLQA